MHESLALVAIKSAKPFPITQAFGDDEANRLNLSRYFPNVDMTVFNNRDKKIIEQEIESEFEDAFLGIKRLPASSRCGVYLAYKFYKKLFNKIKKRSAEQVRYERIRISNGKKLGIIFNSLLRHQVNML